MAAGDEGSAADFRDDGVVWTEVGNVNNLNRHSAAENAFDCDPLVQTKLTCGEVKCGAGAHAAAGCGSIQLTVSKNTNVATVVRRIVGRTNEDRPVKKTKIVFKRMFDL